MLATMAWIASEKTGPRVGFDPRRDDSRGAEIRGVDGSSRANASGLGESGKGVEASRAVREIGTQRAKTPVNVARARDIHHGLHPQTTGDGEEQAEIARFEKRLVDHQTIEASRSEDRARKARRPGSRADGARRRIAGAPKTTGVPSASPVIAPASAVIAPAIASDR
jgi:hypothetical protein